MMYNLQYHYINYYGGQLRKLLPLVFSDSCWKLFGISGLSSCSAAEGDWTWRASSIWRLIMLIGSILDDTAIISESDMHLWAFNSNLIFTFLWLNVTMIAIKVFSLHSIDYSWTHLLKVNQRTCSSFWKMIEKWKNQVYAKFSSNYW